ncbi:hypothetical protein ACROYT_G024688 [Oculina patagonica]
MNRLVILLLFTVAIAMFAIPNEGAAVNRHQKRANCFGLCPSWCGSCECKCYPTGCSNCWTCSWECKFGGK